jgi:hypothetical protein
VRVKLRIAPGQLPKQGKHVRLIHARILQEAEDPLRMAKPALLQHRPGTRGKRVENQDVQEPVRQMSRSQAQVEPEWVER